MPRLLTVAAAQLGPIARDATRGSVVDRLSRLLRDAASQGATLVVFPELALTTFFPRWTLDDEQRDAFFEDAMPGPETQPLFTLARALKTGFCLGYAEKAVVDGTTHRFNSAILVDRDGNVVGRYRKVHLPGDATPRDGAPFQHLEKRYFEVGTGSFPVWRAFGGFVGMAICNDRRWPETYRVMGLQGVEMIMLGYNTPIHNPEAPTHDRLAAFHHRLVVQAGAYQNGTWVVASAKAGIEEGVAQLGCSIIVAPSGEIVAEATTCDDELILAACDLDLTRTYKETIFDFAAHRRPEAYRLITERTGAILSP